MLRDILSYGIGTLVAFLVVGVLLFLFVRDITQKKHSVLRNYPVVGRLRYFFEQLGEYFRQYFFAGDRDEMPFNRANYAMNLNREIDMIAHSCGVRHARELRREHVRIVQASGQSVALNMLYPYPEPKAKMKVA